VLRSQPVGVGSSRLFPVVVRMDNGYRVLATLLGMDSCSAEDPRLTQRAAVSPAVGQRPPGLSLGLSTSFHANSINANVQLSRHCLGV
jgi:hypothetical protein